MPKARIGAGILLGEEVLDVTAFFEIIVFKGDWIEADTDPPTFAIEVAYRDAVDVYRRRSKWASDLTAKINSSPTLAGELRAAGTLSPLSAIKLNPPVVASGKDTRRRLELRGARCRTEREAAREPANFLKCVTALIGPRDEIKLPRISEMIDDEAELAVVIGKEARSVSSDPAMEYVAGYTIMNDVTARDIQRRERQWVRAKELDTFAPCGPCAGDRG